MFALTFTFQNSTTNYFIIKKQANDGNKDLHQGKNKTLLIIMSYCIKSYCEKVRSVFYGIGRQSWRPFIFFFIFNFSSIILYKLILGILPSALAILPASGIDLALYETLKRRIEVYQGRTTNPIEKLIVGNISNSVSQFFIYPLLNVRTRLQSNVGQSDTMTKILKRLWMHHGYRGLYNGFSLHMLRMAPASGISFLTFEYTSKLLGAKAL